LIVCGYSIGGNLIVTQSDGSGASDEPSDVGWEVAIQN
jgi:hypothetical protein